MLESINGVPYSQRSITRDPTTGAILGRTFSAGGSVRAKALANYFKVLKNFFDFIISYLLNC